MTTFEMSPGTCQDLLDALTDAYDLFISKQPGFIAASLHVNDAQTRIANYSQWQRREDFQAMLRTEEMRKRNREINGMCKKTVVDVGLNLIIFRLIRSSMCSFFDCLNF